MGPEIPPSAEGDLRRTPFAHLLVYAVDKRLTGALFLTEVTGTSHVVRFARGLPVKVRPGDGHAMLGQLLVEAGVLSDDLLVGALAAKGLLGDVLVLAGRIERERLDELLERQFLIRMLHLFELPPETMYRYYDGHCELVDWGGEASSVEPLALIWAGLKAHAAVSTKFEDALGRLGDMPLTIHPGATLERFGFDDAERAAVDLLVEKPQCFGELITWDLVPEPLLRRLVYTLLITRQIDVGSGGIPVGSDVTARDPLSTPSGGLAALGRVQLRAAAHRPGAAAPDPAGDGERAPIVPAKRRRGKSSAKVPAASPAATPSTEASAPAEPPAPNVDPPAQAPPGPLEPKRPAAPSAPAISVAKPEGGAEMPPVTERIATEAPPPAAAPPLAPLPFVQDEPTLSAAAFFELAQLRLVERDLDAALEACSLALQVEPAHPDYQALHAWIRSTLPGADVKALTVELDELLQQHDAHVPARYYRGMLRKRLSDDAGALRDLQRVVDLAPGHRDAARELVAVQARQQKPEVGLLSRIFKR